MYSSFGSLLGFCVISHPLRAVPKLINFLSMPSSFLGFLGNYVSCEEL